MLGLDATCRKSYVPGLVLLLLAGPGCGQSVGVGYDSDGGGDGVDAAQPQWDAGPLLVDAALPPIDADGPQWAMLGSNAQRNGQSAFVGPQEGVIRSVQVAPDGLVAVEAIGEEGHVFVWISGGLERGGILVLDPEGVEQWRFPDDVELYPGQGGVAGGSALTLDGALLVKAFLEPSDSTPAEPLVDLFFGLDHSGALDWAWRNTGTAPAERDDAHATVAYSEGGTIYAILGPFQDTTGETDRWLHAFSPSGLHLWSWAGEVGSARLPLALAPDGTLRVLVSHHGVVPPAPDDGLYALDASGQELWFNPLGEAHTLDSLSVNRDGVSWVTGLQTGAYVYPAIIGVGSFGNTVLEIGYNGNRFDGISTAIAYLSTGSPCYGISRRDGTSNVVESGELVCLMQDSGMDIWWLETTGDPCGGLAVDSTDAVYAVTAGNGVPPMIYGVELSGQLRLTVGYPSTTNDIGCDFDPRAFYALSPALGNGRLYVGSMDGQLHIVE